MGSQRVGHDIATKHSTAMFRLSALNHVASSLYREFWIIELNYFFGIVS